MSECHILEGDGCLGNLCPGCTNNLANLRLALAEATRQRDEARRIAADLREMRIGDEKRLNAIIAKVTLQRDEERARSERVACRTKNGSPIDYAAWGSLLEQLGELHLRALTAERERDAALSLSRETDGAVREAAEQLRAAVARLRHETPIGVTVFVDALLLALSSPPRPATHVCGKCKEATDDLSAHVCPAPPADAIPERPEACAASAMTHELKTWLAPFAAVLDGHKRFEIRRFDRPFAIGDTLLLNEWDEEHDAATGRSVRATVTYFAWPGEFGLPAGLCVMGIAPPADAATEAVREAAEYIARCAGCGSSDCTAMADCTGFPSSSRENLIDSCVEDTVRARRILALSTPAAAATKEGSNG